MHNQLQLTYGKVDKQKDKFIRDNLWIKRTDEEELVYRKELERYTSRLTSIKDEIKEIETSHDDLVETFEAIVFLLQNLSLDLTSMNYVRTRYIFWIFSSNIVIDNKKRLRIKRNPLFVDILDNSFSHSADDATRTRNQLLERQWL